MLALHVRTFLNEGRASCRYENWKICVDALAVPFDAQGPCAPCVRVMNVRFKMMLKHGFDHRLIFMGPVARMRVPRETAVCE